MPRAQAVNTRQIYALVDPRTDEAIYVGKSRDARHRFASHKSLARRGSPYPIYDRIREMNAVGITPELLILDEVPEERWREAERAWIQRLASGGLRNLTVGGNGRDTPRESEQRVLIIAPEETIRAFLALSPRQRGAFLTAQLTIRERGDVIERAFGGVIEDA